MSCCDSERIWTLFFTWNFCRGKIFCAVEKIVTFLASLCDYSTGIYQWDDQTGLDAEGLCRIFRLLWAYRVRQRSTNRWICRCWDAMYRTLTTWLRELGLGRARPWSFRGIFLTFLFCMTSERKSGLSVTGWATAAPLTGVIRPGVLVVATRCDPLNRTLQEYQMRSSSSSAGVIFWNTPCDEAAEYDNIVQLDNVPLYRVYLIIVQFPGNCAALMLLQRRMRLVSVMMIVGCDEVRERQKTNKHSVFCMSALKISFKLWLLTEFAPQYQVGLW